MFSGKALAEQATETFSVSNNDAKKPLTLLRQIIIVSLRAAIQLSWEHKRNWAFTNI